MATDDRFTAGDELEAGSLQAYLHGIMMKSELNEGRGAYQISNAVLAASGPSFGPIQYDLAVRPGCCLQFQSTFLVSVT